MSVLTLTEEQVRELLTMEMALEAVETAFRKMALDEVENVPRARARTDHVMLHVMSSAAKTLGYLGYKAYSTSRHGARFHVGLFEGKTGELLALIQADYLGQARTGAASGVATKFMARPEAKTVGIFGAGKQARTQLEAICLVRSIEQVKVYSRAPEHREAFAQEMSQRCQTEVTAVANPEEAARGMDVIVTATNSRDPVLFGEWVDPGTHLNVIGSNFRGKIEVDLETIQRAQNVIVDAKDQARIEAGDLVPAINKGILHWTDVGELSQVVVGRRTAREKPEDVTLFKSLGIALEDVAVAGRIYEKAKANGIGQALEWS